MVFQVQHQDAIFTLKTGYLTNPKSSIQFNHQFNQVLNSGSDFIIFPLFTNQYLQSLNQIQLSNAQTFKQQQDECLLKTILDLDKSMISSDKSIPRKKYSHLLIKINSLLIKKPKWFCFVIGYLAYLGITSIFIEINKQNVRQIFQTLNQLWIDIYKAKLSIILHVSLSGNKKDDQQTWIEYIKFRDTVNKEITNSISISIQIKQQSLTNESITNRWISEGITFVSLNTQSFVKNDKKVIVIKSKPLVRVLFKCLKLKNVGFILRADHQSFKFQGQFSQYIKNIAFIFQTLIKKIQQRQVKAMNLQDHLQNPLQPYSDNLQSETYEIFEFDQPKYDEYQLALTNALEQFPKNQIVNIYYIGAGRGGILPKIFNSSKSTKRKIHVFLIQKNPYPIQTLKQRIKQNKWQKFVSIIHADMKYFKMKVLPDIFVSELLGGFGDNQLSPQCLLWAERFVSEKTICIPKKYSSFIRPTSYRSIHRKLTNQKRQSYYTVQMGKYYSSFNSQKIWQFTHPLIQKQNELNKQGKLQFKAKQNCVVDGFIGYFTTHLQEKNGYLSIRPQDHSPEMYSWFELYFPFLKHELIQEGQNLIIKMKRLNDIEKKIVFYQWSYQIESQQGQKRFKSQLHNKQGNVVAIQL